MESPVEVTAILVWRFDLGARKAREVNLALHGLRGSRNARMTRYLIDSTHTNPYYDYVIAGKDRAGGRYNLETGDLAVVRDDTVRIRAGEPFDVSFELEPMAVTLLVIEP